MKQRTWIHIHLAQPRRPVGGLENDWHAAVQLRHVRIGVRSDDCIATGDGPIRPSESLPQSGEGYRLSVLPGDGIGLFPTLDGLPLIECVGGHDAAPRIESAS